jgi:MoxR-like ATPase
MSPNEQAEHFQEAFAAVTDEIGRVIVGQASVIDATLTALICGGNVLLEGVPGLGKTELVKCLSQVLRLSFNRIQFTPDLMPADIIGTNIMSSDENGPKFEFRQGPIFTQLLLADEINRATPKTQSALLETMQEGSVTAGGQTWELPPPFFVLATQNPLEQEGTYPLPEAQLDRFMFKVIVPFPNRLDLNTIVDRTILEEPVIPKAVLDAEGILSMRQILQQVVVADSMRDYAVRLVLATHPEAAESGQAVRDYVAWGASPRASQALIRAARVRALVSGRVHVSFADIRAHAREVLQHRVLLNYDGQAEDTDLRTLVNDIVKQTPETL